MKEPPRLLQNLLYSALLLLFLTGIYLYAGHQERQAQSAAAAASEEASLAAEWMDVSADGRRRTSMLAALADAGYAVAAGNEPDAYALYDGDLNRLCELILAAQGERVSGATMRFPLPAKPQTAKQPGLIEQALLDRYTADKAKLRAVLPGVFDAALSALDPHGEVPSTARLHWRDLLLDAVDNEKSASDAGEALRLDIYFSKEADARLLCVALQWK